jgi:hypothetical protein
MSERTEEPVVYVVRCPTCGAFEGMSTLADGEIYRHWIATGRQIEETTVEAAREATLCRCRWRGKR